MASRDPSVDPRLSLGPVADEAAQASVRPVVPLRRSGPTGLLFAAAMVVIAVILFGVLDARRRSLAEPSVKVRAADLPPTAAAPPPLYIPPVAPPPPAQLAILPPPVAQTIVRPSPASRAFVQPPAQPQIVISRDPVANAVVPPPSPPPRTGSASPALVIDMTSAPAGGGTSLPQAAENAAVTNGGQGAPQAGGRVRAGAFANRATTVPQGTLIPAVLETAFNSTRPGFARAIVSRDVRGFDGTKVLIPRGSRLTGEYGSDIAPGQKRALINWSRLLLPDGSTIALGSPAGDPLGRGGVRGRVNTHFMERFAGALLQSVLDIGVNVASRAASGNVIVALPGSTQNGLSNLSRTERVVPTLTVAAGTSISVFVARDLDFSGTESAR